MRLNQLFDPKTRIYRGALLEIRLLTPTKLPHSPLRAVDKVPDDKVPVDKVLRISHNRRFIRPVVCALSCVSGRISGRVSGRMSGQVRPFGRRDAASRHCLPSNFQTEDHHILKKQTIMPFDSYAMCPGGRDKKIRFCCPDMTKELEQVQKFLDGRQTSACLAFLDQLESKHPDCACLISARLFMLRAEQRYEEALPIAKAFYEREPANVLARSEYATLTAVTGDPKTALSMIIDGIEMGEEGTLHNSLLGALYGVGTQLLLYGMVIPAIAVAQQLRIAGVAAQQAGQLLYQAMSLAEIPLIIRDTHFIRQVPADFPAKEEFEVAVKQMQSGRWKKALASLEAIAAQPECADRWPTIWKNVAVLALWLLDDEKAVAALDTYGSYASENPEDLGDAAFLRLCLSPDPLGDMTDVLAREYAIDKFDEALETLLSTPQFYRIDFSPNQFAEKDTPPPKCVFVLLDKPFAPEGTAPTAENVSSQWATCMLFGKQTDRPARLEVVEMISDKLVTVDNVIRNAIGPMLGAVGDPVVTRRVSRTQAAVQYRYRFKPENMPTAEQLEELVVGYYEGYFTETFLNGPLGLLDEKTPLAAAGEPRFRSKILGTVTMLDNWMNPEIAVSVCGTILKRLDLPVPGPIAVPGNLSGDAATAFLESVPIWRWYRFEIENMSTELLLSALRMAEVTQEARCLVRFSEELLARPIDSMPKEARFLAFNVLVRVAQAEQNLEEALVWIDRAKSECETLKVSPGIWKVASIGVYLGMGDTTNAQAVIQDVVLHHGKEEDTMRVLQELFVNLGLMNPDGTMRVPGPAGSAPTAPPGAVSGSMSGAAGMAAKASSPPSDGLWTPDGGGSSGGGGSASKLWTPD